MIVLLRSVPLLVCLTAILSILATGSPALAQSDDSVEMARQHFREGVDFYDQREYDKARLAFLQAYALKPHPSVLLNLAQSELRSGHVADAANHFAQYLRESTDPNAPERQEAELGFAAASSKAGAVVVEVDADNAEVLVDGEKRATSPVPGPIYVMPGEHRIEARLGSDAQSQTVRARPGQQETVLLTLRAVSAPGAAGPPMAAPGEEVPMDDAPATADTGGRPPFFKWWARRPLAIVLSVGALASLGGGIAAAVLAGKEFDSANETKEILRQAASEDIDNILSSNMGTAKEREAAAEDVASPCDLSAATRQYLAANRITGYKAGCSSFDEARKTGEQNKKLAGAFFGVAGAAAVGTVVYYFVNTRASNRKPDEAGFRFRPQIAPIVGRGQGGLIVVGQF